jgi:predicted Fe-S protein YdhL (DUF1289 family)
MGMVQYTKVSMDQDQSPESPCIGVCILERDNQCRGCHRTSSEITYWSTFSIDEKLAVLERCKQREGEAQKLSTNG